MYVTGKGRIISFIDVDEIFGLMARGMGKYQLTFESDFDKIPCAESGRPYIVFYCWQNSLESCDRILVRLSGLIDSWMRENFIRFWDRCESRL